jgi:hypothetical protein
MQKNNIKYSNEKQITKRLNKHINDWIISKMQEKKWKQALYKFNII